MKNYPFNKDHFPHDVSDNIIIRNVLGDTINVIEISTTRLVEDDFLRDIMDLRFENNLENRIKISEKIAGSIRRYSTERVPKELEVPVIDLSAKNIQKFTKSNSSQILGFFFDEVNEVLHIKFQNSKIYKYSVTVSEYIDFVEAPSHGKHFHKYIKNKEIKNTKTL